VEIKYPPLLKRVYALLIDIAFIVGAIFIATCLFSCLKLNGGIEKWLKGIVFALVVLYEPLGMRFGATLGYYITGMRIRRYLDMRKKINFFQAICRSFVKIMFGWLSCFTIGFNSQRRALHDMVGESIVIENIK
jgi:uncharacterized RDD family membrane protein YckC